MDDRKKLIEVARERFSAYGNTINDNWQ